MADPLPVTSWDFSQYLSPEELFHLDERLGQALCDATFLVFWTGVSPQTNEGSIEATEGPGKERGQAAASGAGAAECPEEGTEEERNQIEVRGVERNHTCQAREDES